MEWWLVISLLFGGMVFLLLTNLPIAFAFLVGDQAPGQYAVIIENFSGKRVFTGRLIIR